MGKFNVRKYIIKNLDTEKWVKELADDQVHYTEKKEKAERFEGRVYVYEQCKALRQSTGHIHASEEVK